MIARLLRQSALNAVCAYFTMFPLEFPLRVLMKRARERDIILDPFCGRGTTNFAARLLGLPSIGIDASPIAVASTEAKLQPIASPDRIIAEASSILSQKLDCEVPSALFWRMAYRRSVLSDICQLRASLLEDCASPARRALRAIVLGALHGPLLKDGGSSYFSNQCPRTYAPKPRYAVSFWRRNGFRAPDVDVLSIIALRARRYFSESLPCISSRVLRGDSRESITVARACRTVRPNWIITSPPYYGLRTYIADQWLRNWFLGGPESVDYGYGVQLSHRGLDAFTNDLRRVWANVADRAASNAQMIFRFGAINDRRVAPPEIIRASLRDTPWRLLTIVNAGTAHRGKRQADTFGRFDGPLLEYDAWAIVT